MKQRSTQIEAMKAIRKTWGFDPTTRRVESKRNYRRKEKFQRGWE